TIGNEIAEMWHKWKLTKFVDVSPFWQQLINYVHFLILVIGINPSMITRGEEALRIHPQFDQLKWSTELEIDHSIIIWHLATSVCYLQENNHDDEAMKISKHVSDYMMYLLAMCPALLLSEHSKSFWLDHAYDNLKELLPRATDTGNAASALLSIPDDVHDEEPESRERTFEDLRGDVLKLATIINQSNNKWEMIRDVWMEMLSYAAISSQHINHVKQLGEGIEFLSFIWLAAGLGIILNVLGM
ncbi:hypothetical protein SLEP1_g58275, partial [Rubroshorea leprosula]